jgi:hypothetical protein
VISFLSPSFSISFSDFQKFSYNFILSPTRAKTFKSSLYIVIKNIFFTWKEKVSPVISLIISAYLILDQSRFVDVLYRRVYL